MTDELIRRPAGRG